MRKLEVCKAGRLKDIETEPRDCSTVDSCGFMESGVLFYIEGQYGKQHLLNIFAVRRKVLLSAIGKTDNKRRGYQKIT